MRTVNYAEKAREWVVDYSVARAKAIEWLGERYLLAKPLGRIDSDPQAHTPPHSKDARRR